MPQQNDAFIVQTFERLGFGDYFNADYLKGKEAKLAEIPFKQGALEFSGVTLVVQPKVVEEKKLGEGFYVMKGYHAKLTQEGKEDVAQFLPVFKTIGFTVDQATELLQGRAVRHVMGVEEGKPKFGYSQINFQERTENNNFKVMRRADDGSMLKTLGTIGIIARQEEKEDIFKKLQNGERVSVNIRNADGASRVYVQAAVRKTGPGIDLLDMNGTVLKQYPQLVTKQLQALKSEEPGKEIPPAIAAIVTGQSNKRNESRGNKLTA